MKNYLAIIISVFIVASCTKVIDVDLNEADPIIVIEANYSAEDSTVRVLVTQTANYFSNDPQPTINNATVTITDYLGTITTIPFSADGNYELTNYIPVFGTSYTLNVLFEGTTYSASSTMNAVILQEPIYYEFTEGFFGSDPGYLVFLSYLDPAIEGNYTMTAISSNDSLHTELDDITLSEDKLTNGNYIIRPLFQNLYDLEDTIRIELKTISKSVFDYFTELQTLIDPSSAAPANPDYQWTNNALGYFSAYSSSRQELVIL